MWRQALSHRHLAMIAPAGLRQDNSRADRVANRRRCAEARRYPSVRCGRRRWRPGVAAAVRAGHACSFREPGDPLRFAPLPRSAIATALALLGTAVSAGHARHRGRPASSWWRRATSPSATRGATSRRRRSRPASAARCWRWATTPTPAARGATTRCATRRRGGGSARAPTPPRGTTTTSRPARRPTSTTSGRRRGGAGWATTASTWAPGTWYR